MTARCFVIPGEPMGKGRPRFERGHARTPEKTRQYEELVQYYYLAQCHYAPFPKDTPLAVTIEAIFGAAKSDSVKKRQAKLCGLLRPTKKPDFDNLAKIVCDALNGVAWHDDAQIVNAQVIKLYGVEPCVKVWISKEDV